MRLDTPRKGILVTGFGRLRFNAHDGRLNNTVTVFAAYSARAFGEPTRTTYYRGGDVGAEYQAHLKFDALSSLLFGLRGEQEAAYRKRTDKPEPYYDATRSLFAGYLLYQLPLDRLNLSFAVRHDGQIGEQGFTTGRVTAVHDFPDVEARVRASLGTGAKRAHRLPIVLQCRVAARDQYRRGSRDREGPSRRENNGIGHRLLEPVFRYDRL